MNVLTLTPKSSANYHSVRDHIHLLHWGENDVCPKNGQPAFSITAVGPFSEVSQKIKNALIPDLTISPLRIHSTHTFTPLLRDTGMRILCGVKDWK